MKFKDRSTNKIIELEELKENYTKAKEKGKTRYINFQDYLMHFINKHENIEIIQVKREEKN